MHQYQCALGCLANVRRKGRSHYGSILRVASFRKRCSLELRSKAFFAGRSITMSRKNYIAARIVGIAIFALMVVSMASANDLATAVRNRLSNYYSATPFEISTNSKGQVEIKGTVQTYWDKLKVFELASKVDGVKFISDELNVQTSPLPDKIIKSQIESGILNSTLYEPDKINVAVTNGEVILSGTVSFARESMMVEDIAAWQKGVRGVANQITVLPKKAAESDDNLTAVLRDILDNDFPFETHTVTLKVKSGEVTLKGNVMDLWAKQHVAKELKQVPGVTSVVNNLKVTGHRTT